MADERLRKSEQLSGSKQYRNHFRYARRRETSALVFYLKRLDSEEIRFGLTVSRKVGKAVHRNRIKRRLREIFRKRKGSWRQKCQCSGGGIQVVIRPKPEAVRISYQEMDQQFCQAIEAFLNQRQRKKKSLNN